MIIRKNLKKHIKIEDYFTHFKNENVLFFDIETTGFSYEYTEMYLIGCIYFEEDCWIFEQFFAQNKLEYVNLVEYFLKLCENFSHLISFNGDTFDIPYIKKKSNLYLKDASILEKLYSLDLFKIIKRNQKLLNLPNYKLKTIEKFLGIYREDKYNGKELILQYKQYLNTKDSNLKINLLLHNEEDVISMLDLLKIISYFKFLKNIFNLNNFDKLENFIVKENKISFEITLKHLCEFDFKYNKNTWYIYTNKNISKVFFEINLYENVLYHFFDNYKEYYYLPEQDEAIHKTIGQFLDSSKRKPANANNCYIKKSGLFLETFHAIENFKVFKSNKKSTEMYILISESDELENFINEILPSFLNSLNKQIII